MTEENHDGSPQGFDQAEEEWIKEQRARDSKRAARDRDREDSEGDVNINSLMDIMVIILVFLLESFGDQPVEVTGKDLRVPMSTTESPAKDTTSVTVTRSSIIVNDEKPSVDLTKDGLVDPSDKKGGKKGRQIIPLLEDLEEAIKRKKRQSSKKEPDLVVTIVADESTKFRVLTDTMYTASKAGITKFKFAVVRGSRDSVSPVGSGGSE